MPKSRGRKKGRGPAPRKKKKVSFSVGQDQISDAPLIGDSNKWAYFNFSTTNYERDVYSGRSLSSSISLDNMSCSHLRNLLDFNDKNGYIYLRDDVNAVLTKPTWEIASENALEKDCLANRLLMLKHDENSPMGAVSFRNHINKLIKSGRHKDGILNERYRGLKPLDEEWELQSYTAYVNWCMDNLREVYKSIETNSTLPKTIVERNYKKDKKTGKEFGTDAEFSDLAVDQYLSDLIREKIFMTEGRAIWQIGKSRSKIISLNENDWEDCYYFNSDDEEICKEGSLFPVIPFVFREELPDNWFDICFSRRSAYVVNHEDKSLPSFSITKISESNDDVKRFEQNFGEAQKEALLGLGRHVGSGTCFSQTEKRNQISFLAANKKGGKEPFSSIALYGHTGLPMFHPYFTMNCRSMNWDADEASKIAKKKWNSEETKQMATKKQFLYNQSINKQRGGHSDRLEVMRFHFNRTTFSQADILDQVYNKNGVAENDEWTVFPAAFDISVYKDLSISYNGDFVILEDFMDETRFMALRDSIIGLVLNTIKNLVRINQETTEWIETENKDREYQAKEGVKISSLTNEEIEAYEARNISVPSSKKKYYYDTEDGKVKRKTHNKGTGETPIPHIRILRHDKYKNGEHKNRWAFYMPEDFPIPVNIKPEGEYCSWTTVSVGDKDMDRILEARAKHLINSRTKKRIHERLIDGCGELNPEDVVLDLKKASEAVNQNPPNLKPKDTTVVSAPKKTWYDKLMFWK